MKWCAYYGDVSAIRFLLANGERLEALGENLELATASYHGHWRLVQFLIENGADVNYASADSGETPLHAAVSKSDPCYNFVLRVLLANGANPNAATIPGIETGAFMRDVRTRGETPLHRAAAFCGAEAIQLLIDAGGKLDAKDVNGDSPLGWGSWHGRSTEILRLLLYDEFWIHPKSAGMNINLLGKTHV
jgi:ankyrin repeat protein